MQQEVEGPLEDRGADRVRHRGRAYRPPTPDPASAPSGSPGDGRDDACSLTRHATRVLGHPAHRRDAPRQLPRRGAALGRRAQEPSAAPDQTLYCVVDLHAMTLPYDAGELRRGHPRARRCCSSPPGLDPERCILFVQSHVHAAHRAHLDPQLRRHLRRAAAHDPVQGEVGGPGVGERRPVRLPGADGRRHPRLRHRRVPVGDDQRQHLELARDIAIRFNHRFGDTLVVPEGDDPAGRRAGHGPPAARPPRCRSRPTRPRARSSCSTTRRRSPRRSSRAVTDSGTEVRYDPDEKPGVSNLLQILAAVTDATVGRRRGRVLRACGYGAFKGAVADAVVEFVRPLQERYAGARRRSRPRSRASSRVGADRAEAIAAPVDGPGAARRVGLLPRGELMAEELDDESRPTAIPTLATAGVPRSSSSTGSRSSATPCSPSP